MKARKQTTAKTTGRRPGRPRKVQSELAAPARNASQIADSLDAKAKEMQQIARILRGQ